VTHGSSRPEIREIHKEKRKGMGTQERIRSSGESPHQLGHGNRKRVREYRESASIATPKNPPAEVFRVNTPGFGEGKRDEN